MREAQIKAALIDALIDGGFVDNSTVVISELPVMSWSRRADVVLANGRLQGFEIKSKFDKIDRLSAQLDAYSDALEGVSVVLAEKHLEEGLRIARPDIGIFVIEEIADSITVRQLRKPKIKLLSAEAALKLMRVSDLRLLLRDQGVAEHGRLGRQNLELETLRLPLPIIRNAALESIKRRYLKYHQAFINERKKSSSLKAIGNLKKTSWLHHAEHHDNNSLIGEHNAASASSDAAEALSFEPLRVTPRRV